MKGFVQNARGNFAIIGALALPVLLGAAGGMMDYHVYRSTATTLQGVADAAAIASAKESILQGWSKTTATRVADSYVASNLKSAGLLPDDYTINVSVNEADRKVTVEVTQDEFGYLIVGWVKQAPYISSVSTAQAVSDANICVLGLFTAEGKYASRGKTGASIHLDDKSRVQAPDCGIYAESARNGGFRIDHGAEVTANVLCSVGGFTNNANRAKRLDTRVVSDCPRTDDPLSNRPMPTVGACDYIDMVADATTTLNPGVYCGGLTLEGTAQIDLRPGTFIIKDGPLLVNDSVSLSGNGVSFYMTGIGSTFDMQPDTTIELSAPTTGLMAGLLFAEDKTAPFSFSFRPIDLITHTHLLPPETRIYTIGSNDARTLVGTFYLPHGILKIDANAPVADRSAYTAIVAGRVWLREGPTLVLNADYAATSVPVPDGIGPREELVRLVN